MSEQRKMNWLGLTVVGMAVLLIYVEFFQHNKSEYSASVTTPFAVIAQSGSGPMFQGCPTFPADNVWNTRVDGLPRSSSSNNYIDSIGPLHPVHPDFGSSPKNGIPITEVPRGTVGQSVKFDYADESDDTLYPIPSDAKIEGGPQGDGDRHILLVDTSTCLLYELFAVQHKADGWHAGSGIVMDLTSNALRPERKTSADAAGLPILPGLVRYDEAASGKIRHALRFTLPQTQAAYVWPARHVASKLTSTNYAPLGQRFRLRADFDETRFSPTVRPIVVALKRYGMILADNGGALYISGVPDPRWSDDDLHKLSTIHADDFEAVDSSSLRLLPDSARAIQPSQKP